jgi:hypothetical protein
MVGAQAGEGEAFAVSLADQAVRREAEVAVRVVGRVGNQQQVGAAHRVEFFRGPAQAGEVGVAEDVAIHHQEGRVTQQGRARAMPPAVSRALPSGE